MHRVGEIIDNTTINQWRWVPTKENIANLATKIVKAPEASRWIKGPHFLIQPEGEWPEPDVSFNEETSKIELRKHVLITTNLKNFEFAVYYFSDWKRLYRAVANFLLYIEKLRAKCCGKPLPKRLNPDIVRSAKTWLYKQAQFELYAAEITSLKSRSCINKASPLIALNVYLDASGVIRVQGRMNKLNPAGDAIVLPKKSRITFLIAKDYHERSHHMLHETTINLIRTDFHVCEFFLRKSE
ncbi:uncharacterized protein LOC116656444 isoform X1 [Drosophila ananassae]|uniref:uncharacterized protein LOC116656444 isoform X1 n=1 Tax=Drosophila ananassae TaxID=7217 RepID=UPI0013A5DCEE|nr:uncharacterized protein LOC116656444 isoform X1 [Drosophila ananassae]